MGLIKRARMGMAVSLLRAAKKPYSKSLARHRAHEIIAEREAHASKNSYLQAEAIVRSTTRNPGAPEPIRSATDKNESIDRLVQKARLHYMRSDLYEQAAYKSSSGAKKAKLIRHVGKKTARLIAGKKQQK